MVTCLACADNRWVCEEHPDRPWLDGDGCCGAAGMPCLRCNASEPPAYPPGSVEIERWA